MYGYGNAGCEKQFTRNCVRILAPKGWVIADSVNNKWYPFEVPAVDTTSYDYQTIWSQYLKLYSLNSNPMFFPFHFVIETIGRTPSVLTTRPITYKSLIPEYEEYISILIIGDTKSDIFPARGYKLIADLCINPLKYIPSWHIKADVHSNIVTEDLGQNFMIKYLEKYIK